ncbi:MAG: hypothetical protein KBG84_16620, partial [Planctomycetes bacterium]|nr:hypothetical protein [Planctomycetota bacterium]
RQEAQAQAAAAANATPVAAMPDDAGTNSVSGATNNSAQTASADSAHGVPPDAAPAGGAAPEAGNDPQLAATPQQPLFTPEGLKDDLETVQPAAATEAVGPAQTGEPVPAARGTNPTIGAVADGAAARDTSETERLAAIYQLPQPGDWFKAA